MKSKKTFDDISGYSVCVACCMSCEFSVELNVLKELEEFKKKCDFLSKFEESMFLQRPCLDTYCQKHDVKCFSQGKCPDWEED